MNFLLEFLAVLALISLFVLVTVIMLAAFLGKSTPLETARDLWHTYFWGDDDELPDGGDDNAELD